MRIPVEGKELTLKCKVLLPDLNLKPQKLYITSEGYSREVILANQNCIEIKIPTEKKIGEFMWVKLRADYVTIPSEEGGSGDTRSLGVMFYDVKWER